MKVLFLIIPFFACGVLLAQTKIEINGKTRINMDSLISNQQPTNNSSNKMPNALAGFKDNQQLAGNNQQGFDIYQSQVDNMAVLKPDANNAAQLKMLTWNYKSEYIYGDVYDCLGKDVRFSCNYGYPFGWHEDKPKFKLQKLPQLRLDALPIIK